MSGKPKSIYLSNESMRAIAPTESLSPRINQIIDRFSLLAKDLAEQALAALPSGTLARLRDVFADLDPYKDARSGAKVLRQALQSLQIQPARELSTAELVGLLEIVERDREGRRAA